MPTHGLHPHSGLSMLRFLRSLIVAAVTLPMLGACYHYVPLEQRGAEVGAGTGVRVHLTSPRSFEMSGYTAHDVQRVDGALLSRNPDAWIVAANTMYAAGGNRFEAAAFGLDVPVSAIASAEVRTHSWWRTAVASVATAAGVYFLSEALKGTSASGTQGSGGGEERSVIPLP